MYMTITWEGSRGSSETPFSIKPIYHPPNETDSTTPGSNDGFFFTCFSRKNKPLFFSFYNFHMKHPSNKWRNEMLVKFGNSGIESDIEKKNEMLLNPAAKKRWTETLGLSYVKVHFTMVMTLIAKKNCSYGLHTFLIFSALVSSPLASICLKAKQTKSRIIIFIIVPPVKAIIVFLIIRSMKKNRVYNTVPAN